MKNGHSYRYFEVHSLNEEINLSWNFTRFQIRRGSEDNLKIIFFLFLNGNICCDPSLEPSPRGGSDPSLEPSRLGGFNDWSQNMSFL